MGEGLVGDSENVGVAAELHGQPDDCHQHHDPEHDILDDGNDGGRAQTARVGVGGQDDEGCGQRPLAMEPEGGEHDADADQLQRDIGHEGEDAGEGDGHRERPVAVASADEIGEGDIAVPVADGPEPGQHEQHVRVGDDRVRQGEEAVRSRAVEGRGYGDDGVGGVGIAADQEPRHPSAEAASGEAPLFERMHPGGGSAPARGEKAG